jgi:hypothetical protein
MVMRVMLIGFLVFGSVAMLETDVRAHPRPCAGWPCCFFLKELKQAAEQVKKDNRQVWIIGETDDEQQSLRRDKVRQELIQYGLPRENIGELIYKDPALREYMREGQMAIVTQPKDK